MALTSILRSSAILLWIIAAAMFAPMALAFMGGEESAGAYLFAAAAAVLFGAGAFATSLGRRHPSGFRGALIVVLVWWMMIPIFAAMPIMAEGLSFADAYFEAVSAITTTGAWLSNEGAIASPAGALWRAILQWLRIARHRRRDFHPPRVHWHRYAAAAILARRTGFIFAAFAQRRRILCGGLCDRHARGVFSHRHRWRADLRFHHHGVERCRLWRVYPA